MLTVEITSMPASRIVSMSCHRFSCAEPGTFVCANSSTSTTRGARARIAVEIHLLERRVTVDERAPGHHFEVADLRRQ